MVQRDSLFVVETPQGFSVRTTSNYWELHVSERHPTLRGRIADVVAVLRDPDEVRLSQIDPLVYLFYQLERPGRWLCVLAKRLNGEGFVITAYPTDALKEGEIVWTRQRSSR